MKILKWFKERKRNKHIKQLVTLKSFFEECDNSGLMYHKIAHHPETYRTSMSESYYVFIDVTMHDGYSISISEVFKNDALKKAGLRLVERLMEMLEITPQEAKELGL